MTSAASIPACIALCLAAAAADCVVADEPVIADRDAGRGFQIDFTADAWFPRLVGEVGLNGGTVDMQSLGVNDSQVAPYLSLRGSADRLFVEAHGFISDVDGAGPGVQASASWWDVSMDVGYVLWRPFNDRPTPWGPQQRWEGNEARDGGYRFELAIAPTLGFSWDDFDLDTVSVPLGTRSRVAGGWASLRFGGEFTATLHTGDLVGFIESIDLFCGFSIGPSFGASGDGDGVGSLWVVNAGAMVHITRNIGLHLGYRLVDGDFTDRFDGTADVSLQGLVAGGSIRF